MKRLIRAVLYVCAFMQALDAADHLPLAGGNVWTYRNAATGSTFTIRAGSPVTQSGRVYHPLTGYVDREIFVRREETTGSIVYFDVAFGREMLLTYFLPNPLAWWAAPVRACAGQGQTQLQTVVHDGPGGHWDDVLDVRYRNNGCRDGGLISEQYAANIGMVQRVVSTIAGPRRYDLVSARVGSVSIGGNEEAGFTLSLSSVPSQRHWEATLRVKSGNGAPLLLRFPDAQEFNVVLRGPDGRVVWNWAADKLFAQEAHETIVNGERHWTIAVPWPSAPGQDVFTAEAWLTTADRVPPLGAALPVAAPHVSAIADAELR
jgi:hypothetical protein